MSGSTSEESGERNFEATQRKLDQARDRGDIPVSREGPIAGTYLAMLVSVLLVGGITGQKVAEIILPLLARPDSFLDATQQGLADAGRAVAIALVVALAPVFALVIGGAVLPYVLQNSVAISPDKIMPNFSHISPAAGLKRLFGARTFFEFGKNIAKMIAVGIACFFVARPIYDSSVSLVDVGVGSMGGMLVHALLAVLTATTLVAVGVAAVDIPFQHWSFRRRMRMSLEELRKEMRESEGDPHVKARRRKLGRSRRQRRMMLDVPTAAVVITNPTHFAVALRYKRGEDAAPVLVAKGMDLIAAKIRAVARDSSVAIVENPPLARALHATVEIGHVIPQEHFEAVAKIIGMVWAQRNAQLPKGTPI